MANVVTLARSESDEQGLIDTLTQYAVPKYFNKIGKDESLTYVICYCDNVPFLKIPKRFKGSNGNSIYVYASGDWVRMSSYSAATSSYTDVFKMIVTENGLLIVLRTDSTDTALRDYAALPLLITKDNSGKTAVYCQKKQVKDKSYTPTTVYSFSEGDAEILETDSCYTKTNSTAGTTGLIPIYTNSGNLENVWLSFVTQFEPGIFSMTLNGKKYFQYESAVILDE